MILSEHVVLVFLTLIFVLGSFQFQRGAIWGRSSAGDFPPQLLVVTLTLRASVTKTHPVSS